MTASKSIQKLNGMVVFAGTATEISILFNYLKASKTTENFLDDYREVTLEQVLELMELAEEHVNLSLSAQ